MICGAPVLGNQEFGRRPEVIEHRVLPNNLRPQCRHRIVNGVDDLLELSVVDGQFLRLDYHDFVGAFGSGQLFFNQLLADLGLRVVGDRKLGGDHVIKEAGPQECGNKEYRNPYANGGPRPSAAGPARARNSVENSLLSI